MVLLRAGDTFLRYNSFKILILTVSLYSKPITIPIITVIVNSLAFYNRLPFIVFKVIQEITFFI